MWPRARKRCATSRAVFSIGDIFTFATVAAWLGEVQRAVRAEPQLRKRGCFLLLSKRMNNKENNGNADARIGNVKCRPWMQEFWHACAEIEEQEIDHVPVKQPV